MPDTTLRNFFFLTPTCNPSPSLLISPSKYLSGLPFLSLSNTTKVIHTSIICHQGDSHSQNPNRYTGIHSWVHPVHPLFYSQTDLSNQKSDHIISVGNPSMTVGQVCKSEHLDFYFPALTNLSFFSWCSNHTESFSVP